MNWNHVYASPSNDFSPVDCRTSSVPMTAQTVLSIIMHSPVYLRKQPQRIVVGNQEVEHVDQFKHLGKSLANRVRLLQKENQITVLIVKTA